MAIVCIVVPAAIVLLTVGGLAMASQDTDQPSRFRWGEFFLIIGGIAIFGLYFYSFASFVLSIGG